MVIGADIESLVVIPAEPFDEMIIAVDDAVFLDGGPGRMDIVPSFLDSGHEP